MAELDINELFDDFTAAEQVKEATAARTLYAGAYRLRIEKADARIDDREDAPTYGRKSARLTAAAFDRITGERKGNVFLSASWEPVYVERDGNRFLDGPSKLWGQLLKAFEAEGQSAGEFLKSTVFSGAVDGFVTEPFKMADGSFQNYRTPDERQKLVDAGGEPANFVQRIMRVK